MPPQAELLRIILSHHTCTTVWKVNPVNRLLSMICLNVMLHNLNSMSACACIMQNVMHCLMTTYQVAPERFGGTCVVRDVSISMQTKDFRCLHQRQSFNGCHVAVAVSKLRNPVSRSMTLTPGFVAPHATLKSRENNQSDQDLLSAWSINHMICCVLCPLNEHHKAQERSASGPTCIQHCHF